MEHFPVPAPATTEILMGIPIRKGTVSSESTTPTGAAILKAFTKAFTDRLDMRIEKTAYGIGHKDFEIPNVLRVHLAEIQEKGLNTTREWVTECNIDDMNPEWFEMVMDRLFEAGADDVYFTPIQMKKSRPAVTIHVIHSEEVSNAVTDTILKHTTSFGTRRYRILKTAMERKFETVETRFGPVKIKHALQNGKSVKWKPEYAVCREIINKHGISYMDLLQEINKNIQGN